MSLQAFTSGLNFQDLYLIFTPLNLWIPPEINSHGQHFIFQFFVFFFHFWLGSSSYFPQSGRVSFSCTAIKAKLSL